MNYYTDLFSPETYEAFTNSDRTVSGFRRRHEGIAHRIHPGDRLICYLTKLSRWMGVLEVTSESYIDESPRFTERDDPYVVRFKVKPLVWLPREKLIPIHDQRVWMGLSFTRDLSPGDARWTGKVRGSLVKLDPADGQFLDALIHEVAESEATFPFDDQAWAKQSALRVQRREGDVIVSVPVDSEPVTPVAILDEPREARESIRIQALLARIGRDMGLDVWVPRNDRAGVVEAGKLADEDLLRNLPLNYNEATIRTIEQIDVLWFKRRSIIRAFEVEHTTSIYSGILRMADLMALQPNMSIALHIVAPIERRDKVFQEITRPVFSLLDERPLAEICSYLSYESVRELGKSPNLRYLSPSVIEEYEEYAEEK